MLKQRHEQIQVLVRLTDVAVTVSAFFAAYGIRTRPALFPDSQVRTVSELYWILAASLVVHLLIYPLFGFYQSLRLKAPGHILAMILRAGIVEFFVLGALVFLFQQKETSRYFFGIFLATNYVFLAVEKLGARVLLSTIRKRGYNFRRVLVVGTGTNAKRVIESLRWNRHWGYVPEYVLLGPGEAKAESVLGVPVVGGVDDLAATVSKKPVDEVYLALDQLNSSEVQGLIRLCESLGVPIRLALGLLETPNSRVTFSMLDHVPLVTYYRTLMTPVEAGMKRAMDLLIAVIGLFITAILLPWIAWGIRREGPGRIIYKSPRVGENGRRFKCYKFRTMHADADSRKAELVARNQMEGPLFKVADDPRITRFGAFLRRSSLDELPQFFNILRGDMSVVGTRPPTPDEVERYEMHYRRRLSIRPGLTGLWQVSGRNHVKRFEDVLALDLKYIDHWSIWLDLKIIARTLWVALFRQGAY